ncbi:DUF3889 domain-containing protein [Bacillus sp. FJAT-22090]|uniref:DUF3889 domain-containing protein n=1 Tax=Bacillus sp. FJAT-22090 TaxID=1581038 RepID=UPI0011A2EF2F|nr:DUF3889 domain-containing protein [Bacillus sp. FJAT-22090]
MKKTFISLGLLFIVSIIYPLSSTHNFAQLEEPSYAKWGKIAIKETQLKYPNAKIIDYLHEESESKEGSTVEKFKLWLKDSNHEFGVLVRITYTTDTEKMVNIEFHETTS